jgi:hypothetical protein
VQAQRGLSDITNKALTFLLCTSTVTMRNPSL